MEAQTPSVSPAQSEKASSKSGRFLCGTRKSWAEHWLVSDSFKALVGMQLAFCLAAFIIGNLSAGSLTLTAFIFGITASMTSNYNLHLVNAGVQFVSWLVLVIGMITGFGSMSQWHVSEQYLAIGIFQLLSALAFVSVSVITVIAVKEKEENKASPLSSAEAEGVSLQDRCFYDINASNNGGSPWCVNIEAPSPEKEEGCRGLRVMPFEDIATPSDERTVNSTSTSKTANDLRQFRLNALGRREQSEGGHLQVAEAETDQVNTAQSALSRRQSIRILKSYLDQNKQSPSARKKEDATPDPVQRIRVDETPPHLSTNTGSNTLSAAFLDLSKHQLRRDVLASPNISPLSNVSLNTVTGAPAITHHNTDPHHSDASPHGHAVDSRSVYDKSTPPEENDYLWQEERVRDKPEISFFKSLVSSSTTAATTVADATSSRENVSEQIAVSSEESKCFAPTACQERLRDEIVLEDGGDQCTEEEGSLAEFDMTENNPATPPREATNTGETERANSPPKQLSSGDECDMPHDVILRSIETELSPQSRPTDGSPSFSSWVGNFLKRQSTSRRNHYAETPNHQMRTSVIKSATPEPKCASYCNGVRKPATVLLTTARSELNLSVTEEPISHPIRGDIFNRHMSPTNPSEVVMTEDEFCGRMQRQGEQQKQVRPPTPMPNEAFTPVRLSTGEKEEQPEKAREAETSTQLHRSAHPQIKLLVATAGDTAERRSNQTTGGDTPPNSLTSPTTSVPTTSQQQ